MRDGREEGDNSGENLGRDDRDEEEKGNRSIFVLRDKQPTIRVYSRSVVG